VEKFTYSARNRKKMDPETLASHLFVQNNSTGKGKIEGRQIANHFLKITGN
jgi:hypothetical protein